jgi:hypothetical protein
MIGAILVTVALLAAFWIYVIPLLQGAIPASITQNKWMQFAVTGLLLLVTVWVVGMVVKAVGVKSIAAA